MRNTLLMLTSLLLLTGCLSVKKVYSLQDRGGVKYEVDSERSFTGNLVEYYENGQKQSEGHYKNGQLNGLYTDWYKNGQMALRSNWKGGMEAGLWTEWYRNGQKRKEGYLRKGNEVGLWITWDKNGQKAFEIN